MGYDKFNRTLSAARLEGRQGVYSYGVPVFPSPGMLFKGDVFHVDSGHLNADDTGNGKDPNRPLKKIDTAIGKCAANNGDVILVSELHAETVTAAAGIALDVAGVTIVGLGSGEARAIVTFGTAAGASFDVTAANCRVENLLFKNNIDSQTAMLNVTAKDFTLVNCEFREGSAKQALLGVNVGAADNDADRFKIFGCVFNEPTLGANSAIKLTKVQDGVEIIGNNIYGDFGDAGIHNPTAAICTNLLIANNNVSNLQTGDHAIELVSACTGMLIGNALYADAEATILDPGSLKCVDNWANDSIDAPSFAIPATAADTAANMVGADNANNDAATTNVVANKDGSVLERLEDITQELSGTAGLVTFPAGAAAANAVSLAEVLRYLQENVITGTGTALEANSSLFGVLAGATGVVTYPAAAAPANGVSLAEVLRRLYDDNLGNGTSTARNSHLGIKVSKAGAALPASTTQNIFTISGGRVLVTMLTGEVTVVVQAQACNLSVNHVTDVGGDNVLASTVDINADEAGTLYGVEGDGTALVATSSSAFLKGASGGDMVLAEGTINIQTSATNTGSTSWELWYFPLDDGATVASA